MPFPDHVSQLFVQALKISDASERQEFVRQHCSQDPAMEADLLQMLRVHEQASGFLSQSPQAWNDQMRVGRESVLKRIGDHIGVAFETDSQDGSFSETGEVDAAEARGSLHWQSTVGRYQLQGEITRGGMGAILKGRDVDLGRNLAIKVLLANHSDDPAIVERFIEEAQIGGQLQHPGIAPVYELGTMPDQRPFFSMKLVKGQTLAALLSDRKASQADRSRFLGIFEQICQTVAYAHSRRVIHRDLKPANIMVGAFGEVQVMDWGLAKVLKVGGIADEKRARDTQLGQSLIQTVRSGSNAPQGQIGTRKSHGSSGAAETHAGSVMGTPAYMPPEQALGEVDRLDERCDVFGLGAILCEILTGQPPYVAEDSQDLFRMAARGKMDQCHARLDDCGADRQLIDLAKHSIEPEVENRIRSGGELSKQLTDYLQSVETRLRAAEVARAAEATKAIEQRKRRRVSTALAASVVLLFAMCGAGWIGMQVQAAQRAEAGEARLSDHVNDAKLHHGLAESENLEERAAELEKAIVSAKQAAQLANGDGVSARSRKEVQQLLKNLQADAKQVEQQLAQRSEDQRTKDRLEFIRLSDASGGTKLEIDEGSQQFGESTSQQYKQVFDEIGISLENLPDDRVSKLIRESAISSDLIAGLDHWSASISRATPDELINAALGAGNWEMGIKVARDVLRRDPDLELVHMRLAVMLIMSGDEAGYRKACRDLLDQIPYPKNHRESGRISKTCLLLPQKQSGVDIDELQTKELEMALDEGGTHPSFPRYGWCTRALIAYRAGEWKSCQDYLEKSHASNPNLYCRALSAVIGAMADEQLGDHDAAEQKLNQLDELLNELRTTRQVYMDALIPLLLRRQAVDLIRDGKGQLTFDQWASKNPVREDFVLVEQSNLRDRLIRIANQVDENQWRKSVRSALSRRDESKLVDLAGDDNIGQQPPQLAAWLATELRALDQPDEAITILTKANETSPGDFWINYELAKCLSLQGKSDIALGFARSALALRPTSLAAQWQLISVLDDSGHQQESSERFEQLIAKTEFDESEYEELCWDLLADGRYGKAVTIAKHWISETPESATAHYALAQCRVREDNLDDAIEAVKMSVQLDPTEPRHHHLLGWCLLAAKRDEEAEATYRKQIELAEAKPESRPEYNNLGVVLERMDRLEEAAEMYRKAIQNGSTNSVANLRGVLTTLQKRDYTPEIGQELRSLATVQSRVNRTRIDQYLDDLKRNPRDTEKRHSLIGLLLEFGRSEEAETQYAALLTIDPDNASIHSEFAQMLSRLRKPDEALLHARRAAELDPQSGDNKITLARVLKFKATGDPSTSTRSPVGELTAEQTELIDEAIAIVQGEWKGTENERSPASILLVDLLRRRGRLEEASEVLAKTRAVGGLRSQVPNRDLQRRTSMLASRYLRQPAEYQDDLDELRKSFGVPGVSPYLVTKVVSATYEHNGDHEQAIKDLKAATSSTRHPALSEFLAWLLALQPVQDGDFPHLNEALKHAQIAQNHLVADSTRRGRFGSIMGYRTNPESKWMFSGKNTLGMVHYRREEYDKALTALNEFNDLGFTEPNNWLFLAMTHWQLDNKEEAQQWYDKAKKFLADNPPSRDEKLILAETEKLMGKTAENEQ